MSTATMDSIVVDPSHPQQSQQQQQQHASSSFAAAGDSILSEKVTRALQVRTDTPAMKAALDALALLSTTTSSVVASSSSIAAASLSSSSATTTPHLVNTANNTVMWIDSRSVRVVMEQDALQQALLLQEQLQQLVQQVTELRLGVTHIANIATKVQDAIHTNVVVSANTHANVMYQPNQHNHHQTLQQQQQQLLAEDLDHSERSSGESKDDTFHSMMMMMTTTNTTAPTDESSSSSSSSLEQEQKLAATLYDSFRHRQASRQRLEAVLTFLEKFDLSEQDARLLDHYAFEDVVLLNVGVGGGGGSMDAVPVNGMAFLTALHRVRNIRQALGQTFGNSGSSSALEGSITSSSSSSTFGATSALRMMESLAQKQEKAYERLYHWLQKFLHLHTTAGPGESTALTYDHNHMMQQQHQQQLEDQEDVLDEALIQNVFVKRALHTLQHVPAFYAHTLELIATFRRGRETRKFLLALTSGYSGMPPLELKAHDAVQYVGDMLAFMFQQTNMEADVAKNVLLTPYREQSHSYSGGDGNEERPEDDTHDPRDEWYSSSNRLDYAASPMTSIEDRPLTAAEMVAQAMGGVARPLKSRILQVIANLARRGDDDDDEDDDGDNDGNGPRRHRSSGGHRHRGMEDDLDEEGSVARRKTSQLYEICGLLSFYHSALNKTIQKLRQTVPAANTAASEASEGNVIAEEEEVPNPLVSAVLECWTAATNGYVASLRVYGAMLEQLAVLTGESEASLAHAMMVQLAQVRVASPGFAADMELPNAQHQTDVTTATSSSQNAAKALSLEWILETLIDSSLPLCKSLDDALLLKQGLSVAKKSGMSGEVAALLEDRIQQQESKLIEGLVEVETANVLEFCGLGSVATSWKRFRELHADEIGQEAASVTAVMAGHPGLSQSQLEAAMKEFYASLYSPPLPSLERTVENVTLRKLARQKIASNVADFYAELYSYASRPASGYTDVSFLGHTPEQVRTLFSA